MSIFGVILVRIFSHSNQNNSEYGQLLRSGCLLNCQCPSKETHIDKKSLSFLAKICCNFFKLYSKGIRTVLFSNYNFDPKEGKCWWWWWWWWWLLLFLSLLLSLLLLLSSLLLLVVVVVIYFTFSIIQTYSIKYLYYISNISKQ